MDDADFTRPRVLAYEPRSQQPPAADPLEVAVVEKQRRRLVNSSILYVVLAAAAGLLVPEAFTLTLAGVLGAVVVPQMYLLFFRVLPCRKLLAHPTALVAPGPGELLVAGSRVSVALPGAEPRWLVVRLPESRRLLLAGDRRVFLVGPDPRGRVLVGLPGAIIGRFGRFGRIRPEPAPGAVEPAAPSRDLVEARHDPVVTAFLRELWRRSWGIAVSFVLLAAVIWTTGAAVVELSAASAVTTVLAVLYAVLGLLALVRMAGLSAAVQRGPWQELYGTLDTDIQLGASGGLGKAEGRVLLADGEAPVRFQRVPLDLLVNVRDTGRLWVLGAPRQGKKVVAGLPGHPVLGLVNLR
ncbi:hypothetical protein [Amycolatopsis viridis]|uniref:PH domain-containing protein n=1 Tax=Amycolatopsis viridis TaxID=185678 RepID=A0ABX0SKJ6_9PSEU|nr:hypothetical protein [Amycolatopsis viridis]NIH77509.1 hypothetical protein [Amycolatopsis viridis]